MSAERLRVEPATASYLFQVVGDDRSINTSLAFLWSYIQFPVQHNILTITSTTS